MPHSGLIQLCTEDIVVRLRYLSCSCTVRSINICTFLDLSAALLRLNSLGSTQLGTVPYLVALCCLP